LFTGTPAVAQLDFNPHRAFRRAHGRYCACGQEEEGDDEDGRGIYRCGCEGTFTVESSSAEDDEGLPYRRTGIVLPEDSDAYFGNERIVRVVVRGYCPLGRNHPYPSFFFLLCRSVAK
jgi:hypothetical protein